MADAIAKAYVQMLPTTEGFEGKLDKELSPKSKKSGEKAGKESGGGFAKTMIKAIAAAGIAKTVGDFVKGAVDAGGALQQSIGGIETLFKNDADTMVNYANDAWRTVGISANDYMENVTSFSASLLQGLGGDTAKAAEVANMAMVDMGDNANKFGTDMQSIQNAYQGFAKQNYTMLDNLKLGYGGTKQEMERLLQDAQKISGVEYNIDNLSDVYSAIHVIQEELDVAGTTAREATTTLSGAAGAMKASWENLKGAMALGEGIDSALEALMSSTMTYVRNLIPMIGNVLKGMGASLGPIVFKALNEILRVIRATDFQAAAQDIANSVTAFIQGDGLGHLLNMVNFVLTSLVSGINEALPILMPAVVELLSYFVQTLIEQAPMLLQAGLTLLQGITDGLIAALPVLIQQLPALIQTVIDFFVTAAPMLLEAGGQLLAAIGNGIVESIPVLMAQLPQITQSIINFITWNLPGILEQGFKLLKAIVDGIIKGIPQIGKAMLQGIKQVGSTIAANGPLLRASGQKLLYIVRDGLKAALGALASVGLDIVRGIWNGISSAAGWLFGQIRSFASNLVASLKDAMKIGSPSKVMAEEIGQWIPAGIAVGIEDNAGLIDDAMQGLRSDLTGGFTPSFYQSLNYRSAEQKTGETTPITINVYPAKGQDEEAIAKAVERRLITSLQRKGAAFA